MYDIPVIQGDSEFPAIPSSVRMAIILPTVRWTPMAKSVLASMVGTANEEIAVLIADNSENPEKREFLGALRKLNPNILAVSHYKNIGGKDNLLYLFKWSKDIEFIAQMGDDDWMSPTYHSDSYRNLLLHSAATCSETGTTFVDIGDGQHVNVSQPSMRGDNPLDRMRSWNGIAARATMYNTSRRSALNAALQFLCDTPLPGMTLAEDLWELNRLACGDFISTRGPGCFVHYPEHGSIQGDPTTRFYNILCKDVGLTYYFVYFMGLSTAVQCAIFLMCKTSPIANPDQRMECAQHVFAHIFVSSFLPHVGAESSQAAALELLAAYPDVATRFTKYCNPPFSLKPTFDRDFLIWFIELLKVFELKREDAPPLISTEFAAFANRRLENIF
jgi:hypothetical protein